MGWPRLVGIVAPHLVLVAHEAAADGEIGALRQDRARRVEGGEGQGVGVLRQPLAPGPDHVAALVECNGVGAAELQRPARPDRDQRSFAGVRIHGGGLKPGEAENYRPVGGVSPPRQGQRGVEPGLDPGHPIKKVCGLQPLHEPYGRRHRPHGVAGRGTDPQLEQIEGADKHVVFRWGSPG